MENNKLQIKEIGAHLEEKETQILLNFQDLPNIKINLSEQDESQVKTLFDTLFEYIIDKQTIPEFKLINGIKNDNINEMISELLKDLNEELQKTNDDFIQILEIQNTNFQNP